MTISTKAFIRDPVILGGFIWGVCGVCAGAVILWMRIPPTALPVALHYSVYFTVDRIGEWQELLYPFLIVFAGILVNFGIAFVSFEKHPSIAHHLALVTALFGSAMAGYGYFMSTIKFIG